MEIEFVRWLEDRLPRHPALEIGIGDDAAVVGSSNGGRIVVTTDLISDGVDFVLSDVEPRLLGRKALAVNLSDLAAMAARPLAAVVAIALPRDHPQPRELATGLYEGLIPLAEQFNLALAGGDTNRHDGPLVISVAAWGEPTSRGPLRRSTGRPGDRLLVTGRLGGSILGHHLDFEPRVREAILLHERFELHAGMDISDGLALDTFRLAEASNCGAIIDVERLPIAKAAHERAAKSGKTAVEHALADGEDFELLLAVSPDEAERVLREAALDCGLHDIGELTHDKGLWQRYGDGRLNSLSPRRVRSLVLETVTRRNGRVQRMNSVTIESRSEADTERFGQLLAQLLPADSVVALTGTLGAGKTRLVQAIAAGLGVPRDAVISPTFVLIHEYRQGRIPVFHFDVYRLRDADEFGELGPEEYFDAGGICLVEWADRIQEFLPPTHLRIEIEVTGTNSRRITVAQTSAGASELIDRLAPSLPTD